MDTAKTALEEKEIINFAIPHSLYEKTKREAARLGIPLAGFIRMQLIKYFEEKEKEE